MLLATELQRHGLEVFCLRSRLATYPISNGMEVIPFSTNDELAEIFQQLSIKKDVAAIFHAAALCDYRVKKIEAIDGRVFSVGKIPTHAGELIMTLEPSLKVIAKLRSWFPNALLVGWKYEVDGTLEEACAKASGQIEKYQLDASIANGPALGSGFEFIPADGARQRLGSKSPLIHFLVRWLQDTLLQTP